MDPLYISPQNEGVKPAAPGEFAPIKIGPILGDPPVVLAPMAGITNAPFRRLCRGFGAGLFVSEMITARALVERNEKTMRLAEFDPDESPRSLQLYGVDPHYVSESVKLLVDEDRIDHLDKFRLSSGNRSASGPAGQKADDRHGCPHDGTPCDQ